MTRLAFAMSLGFGILALTAQQLFSQGRPNCAPRHSALQQLSEKWGETRRSVMLANGRILEVYAADQSGTWTILATMPDGLSCIVASGVAYERTAPPAGAPA
jgi:hypothetical protein